MANANRVFLIGNITKKPELNYTPQGKAVTNLAVAINSFYKDKNTNEFVKKTDFINVTVFGPLAENCEKHLITGSGVYVEGRLQLQQWKNEKGENRSKLAVIGNNVQFLSRVKLEEKKEDAPVEEKKEDVVKTEKIEPESVDDDDEEDIPF